MVFSCIFSRRVRTPGPLLAKKASHRIKVGIGLMFAPVCHDMGRCELARNLVVSSPPSPQSSVAVTAHSIDGHGANRDVHVHARAYTHEVVLHTVRTCSLYVLSLCIDVI